MLRLRFFSRCRITRRRAFFLWLLVGMGTALALTLPPEPRWKARGLASLAFSRDGRLCMTAPCPSKNMSPKSTSRAGGWVVSDKTGHVSGKELRDLSTGPLQVRDVASGKEQASFFPDAAGIEIYGFPPDDDKTVVIGVQPARNARWELHFLDVERLTTRKLAVDMQPTGDREVHLVPKTSLAVIFESIDLSSAFQQCSLVDLATTKLLQRWTGNGICVPPVVNENFVFFACNIGEHWQAMFWDVHRQQVHATADSLSGIRISGNKMLAATTQKLTANRQRVKIWDLKTATVLSEAFTPIGEINFFADGHGGLILPEGKQREHVGAEGTIWHVAETRVVGAGTVEANDWWNVVDIDGRPFKIAHAAARSEISLCDVRTQEMIWRRTWSRESYFPGRFIVYDSGRPKTCVALGNDIELLDFATGKTLHRIPNVGQGNDDGVFAHGIHSSGRCATIIGSYFGGPLDNFQQVATQVEDWMWPRQRSGGIDLISVIDLESGSQLFHWKSRWVNSFQGVWLSPDADILMFNYIVTNNASIKERVIECYDIPTRKSRSLAIGIPLGFGFVTCLLRCVWLKLTAKPQRVKGQL